MNKPEMCCTCKFWSIGIIRPKTGKCSHAEKADKITKYDDKCPSWKDCDNKTTEKVHNLGYD